MSRTILCLGEGHADCDSLPTLLTRVSEYLRQDPPVVLEPIRFRRNRLLMDLSRLLGLARRKLRTPGGVLIVLDADEDCPADLGPSILQRAADVSSDMPVAAVVAKRMFESWVIAGAEGLIKKGEVRSEEVPADPESVGSPKQWLSERIDRAGGYGEVADLKRLAACFSIEHAHQRSPSFRKLCKEVGRLLGKGV